MSDNTQAELRAIIESFFSKSMLDRSPKKVEQLTDNLLDWHNKQVEGVLDRLKPPTINDVFPSKPYDGTHTHSDMVAVVEYYEGLIEAERERLSS